MYTEVNTLKNLTKKMSTNLEQQNIDNNIEVMSFIFKGSLFALTSIQIQGTNLKNLDEHLQLKIKQAPGFFKNAPMVIDLSKLPADYTPDISKLIACLRNNNLIPIGIKKTANHAINQQALENNLAILAENKSNDNKNNKNNNNNGNNNNTEQDINNPICKVITQPVRSGQQIYARGGDLIILAPVSNGAEILADGNIHVYGPLRGRALAGVMNNKDAHIFCQSLEAELVSIAGSYQVSENLRDNHWKQSVHIQLCNSSLEINKIV